MTKLISREHIEDTPTRKVMFFIPSRCGGAERVAATISKYASNAGLRVSWHTIGDVNQIGKYLPHDDRVVWHERPSHTAGLISIARKAIKEERPDVVFTSNMPFHWRIALASIGLDVKLVMRSENYIETQGFFQRLRLAIAYRMAKIVITQTEEMRRGLVRKLLLPKSKVKTMPNPIDENYIRASLEGCDNPLPTDGSVNYVTVGRVHPVKGFDILIRAFAKVKEVQHNAKLFIVGAHDGNKEYYDLLLKQVVLLGLMEDVFFTGFKDNPYSFMKYADCYVLSSRNEGLPNVLIESLYLGTPAAATTCIPAIARIVDNGKNGYLAKSEDADDLSHAMLKASALGRIVSTYKPTRQEEFVRIFETI